jgi:5'-AMP-activated protein kinase catalytic alpha subunit
VAIKIIDKNKLKDEVDKKRVEREINILKNTFHYNIIKIYQVKETSSTIYLIMEYAEGGELFTHIIEQGNLSEDESRNIFQQIIDAIDYFHQIGICHRDLKPENILFDTEEKKRIKIIDFGLSNLYIARNSSNDNNTSFTCEKDLLETPCGSPGYAPPEMIIGYKYDGIMTDIWSCGVILYTMLCGCLPFDDYTEDKLYLKIIKGKFYYPPMIKISKEAKNLINSLLVVNPKYRATIKDIKKNKWFSNNYKPNFGLFISICEIPVCDLIVKEMKNLGYNEKKIIEYIKNNNHNSITTIYYLLVKKKTKQGIGTESDMISHAFHQ